MSEQENNIITVIDEEGNEIIHEIIFTFDSDQYEKSYVFYAPALEEDDDEEQSREVMCSSFNPSEDGTVGKLYPIEDDEEWDMAEEVFTTFLAEEEGEQE